MGPVSIYFSASRSSWVLTHVACVAHVACLRVCEGVVRPCLLLLPLLQFGDVKDIIILKDKVTGQPRGCAFVSYATKEEAEAAIAALNKGVHLPGALCPMEVGGWVGERGSNSRRLPASQPAPWAAGLSWRMVFGCAHNSSRQALVPLRSQGGMQHRVRVGANTLTGPSLLTAAPVLLSFVQVRYARSHQYVQAGSGPQDNRQLFFARAPTSTTEDQLKQLFGKYGQVRQRSSRAGQGCRGLASLASRLLSLHDRRLLSNASLSLACAMPQHTVRVLAGGCCVRLCMCVCCAACWCGVGQVEEVNLFRERRTHVSKGCGFITMQTRDQAIAVSVEPGT